jgi:VCBS repeat-containing protein
MTQFTGTPSTDTLTGGAGDDILEGLDGSDRLVGGGGADKLYGGAGDDTLSAGQGALVVDGGAGIDTAELDFHAATQGVSLSVANAQTGLNILGTEVLGVEQMTFVSGSGADTLIGGARADSLDAGGGDDLVWGGQGDRLLAGGGGTDLAHLDFTGATLSLRYTVGGATQTLSGVQVSGFEQADMTGGSVGDWLTGGVLNDTFDGAAGNDWLKGDGGGDLLKGGDGYDILEGGAGNDTLDGGGPGWADQLTGGDGDDLLIGDTGDAAIDGGAGRDHGVLDFGNLSSPVAFSIAANQVGAVKVGVTQVKNLESVDFTSGGGGDSLAGGAYSDTLRGNEGDDRLSGEGGSDSLSGGSGADTLTGGAGDDLLDGGAGIDAARFSGLASDYKAVLLEDGGVRVTDLRSGGPDGVDVIHGVEQFVFADRAMSFAELVNGQANRPPAAVDDAATVTEDTGVGIDVLANDSDPDLGDTIHLVSIDAGGVAGSVSAIPGGSVVYSAGAAGQHLNAGETMVEHFTYTVADQNGAQSTAGVTVMVTGLNDAPTLVNDVIQASEDGPTTIHVLANDSDVDSGDTLTLVSASGTSGGVKVTADGDLVFTPGSAAQALNEGQTKTESLSYTVKDSHGATSTGSVAVVVHGANDAPSLSGDAVSASKVGVSLFSNLLSNDFDVDAGDHLTLSGVLATSAKGAAVTFDAQGHVSYDPGGLFTGLGSGETAQDSFTYQVTDAHGATSTATVDVTITGASLPEERLHVGAYATEDGATDNLYDFILDQAAYTLGQDVTLVSVGTAGTRGSVTQGDQSIVYIADDPSFDSMWADDQDETQFLFTVRTADGHLHTGAVDVVISGVNDVPVAVADAFAINEGASSGNLWDSLLANDTDADDGQAHSISAVDTAGTLGHVSFDTATHSLVYSADTAAVTALQPGQTLLDHFGYTFRDEIGAISTTIVSVTVTGAGAAGLAAQPAEGGWMF